MILPDANKLGIMTGKGATPCVYFSTDGLFMFYILLLAALVLLMYSPMWWIKRVLSKHSGERSDFPGTGGDMARHLLRIMEMDDVKVEETQIGDHYDPAARAVRLTKDKLDGRTLTGVVVAAHEVGHAIQHFHGDAMFSLRTGIAQLTMLFTRAAPIFLIAIPLLSWWNPGITRWALIAAIGSMVLGVILNLVTLPVELDASFGKALPLLQKGEYLNEQDIQSAHQILRAAAFTYVAASLASLLNLGVLARVLRR